MPAQPTKPIELIAYCGHAGDHNSLAMAGALALGTALSGRLGLPLAVIGKPGAALNAGWETQLSAAASALSELAGGLDRLLAAGRAPILALSRCAAALATLPVVMRHRPDACVVWLDAHGDLNTPLTTISGYLGGMALAGPAGLWDSGFGNGLPLSRLILIGARDLDPAERALVDAGAIRLVPAGQDGPARLQAALDGRPLYVHLDCDVLEPGIVPTDYRVAGGYTLAGLNALCQVMAQSELIGFEIAEFEAAWSENGEPVAPDALLQALEPLISELGAGAVAQG